MKALIASPVITPCPRYYTPSTPNDLRVQLQTALDMLQLLTCDGTIAGRGIAHVLDPRRWWGQMTTILNNRFQSEPEFGAKFCYTLDRHLQTFFDKVTPWGDEIADEGQPRYLSSKADELIEKLEGRMVGVSTWSSPCPDGQPRMNRRHRKR